MSLSGLLVETLNMGTKDGDFSLSKDGSLLIAHTKDAEAAFHAVMESPVFPFTLANWGVDESTVIRFPENNQVRGKIKSVLRQTAAKIA